MPFDLALLPTLFGSNHPCLELIFMVPKVFEPLMFDCMFSPYGPTETQYHSIVISWTDYEEFLVKSSLKLFRYLRFIAKGHSE